MDDKKRLLNKREYYNLNKYTIGKLFKVVGIGATSVIALLTVIATYDTQSFGETIFLFLLILFIGNLISLTLSSSIFFAGYWEAKAQFKFFYRIPEELKTDIEFELYFKPLYSKYSLLEIHTLFTYENTTFSLVHMRGERQVWINMMNELSSVENIMEEKRPFDKKYKTQNIELTGLGLRKVIKYKDWDLISKDKFINALEDLHKVSTQEGFDKP